VATPGDPLHAPLQIQKREIETLKAELRDANGKRTAAAQEAAELMEKLSAAERRMHELDDVRLELHQQVGPCSTTCMSACMHAACSNPRASKGCMACTQITGPGEAGSWQSAA
jgi:hypothetical protein